MISGQQTHRPVGPSHGLTERLLRHLIQQLAMSAQKRWRRLRGFGQFADLVAKVKFVDGIDEREITRNAA